MLPEKPKDLILSANLLDYRFEGSKFAQLTNYNYNTIIQNYIPFLGHVKFSASLGQMI